MSRAVLPARRRTTGPALVAAGYAVVAVGLAVLLASVVRAGFAAPAAPRAGTAAAEVPTFAFLVGVFASGLGLIALSLAGPVDPAPARRSGRSGGSRRRARLVLLTVAPIAVAPLLTLRAAARPVPLALLVVLAAAALLLAAASALVAGGAERGRPVPARRPSPARGLAVVRGGGQLDLGLFGLFTGMATILLAATAYVLSAVDGPSAAGALQGGAALATALLLVPHTHAAWLARGAAAGPRPALLTRAVALQRAAALAAVPTALLVAAAVATAAGSALPGPVEGLALARAVVLLLGLYLAAFSTDRTVHLAPGGAGDLSRGGVAA